MPPKLTPNFTFRCPKCGEYGVTPDFFRSILLPDLEGALDEKIKTGNVKVARLVFRTNCPKCLRQAKSLVDLEVDEE